MLYKWNNISIDISKASSEASNQSSKNTADIIKLNQTLLQKTMEIERNIDQLKMENLNLKMRLIADKKFKLIPDEMIEIGIESFASNKNLNNPISEFVKELNLVGVALELCKKNTINNIT